MGPYLAGRDLPVQPWLTQRVWPDWLPLFDPYLSDLRSWRQHPSAQRVLPEEIIPRMAALWMQRKRLLHALAQLPRCFCHRDAFRRNLFARRDAAGQAQTHTKTINPRQLRPGLRGSSRCSRGKGVRLLQDIRTHGQNQEHQQH